MKQEEKAKWNSKTEIKNGNKEDDEDGQQQNQNFILNILNRTHHGIHHTSYIISHIGWSGFEFW